MYVCLRVLRKENKSRYDSFSVKDVPCFENVQLLKYHIFKRCDEELSFWGDEQEVFYLYCGIQTTRQRRSSLIVHCKARGMANQICSYPLPASVISYYYSSISTHTPVRSSRIVARPVTDNVF